MIYDRGVPKQWAHEPVMRHVFNAGKMFSVVVAAPLFDESIESTFIDLVIDIDAVGKELFSFIA
jgi:hypothetical protein